MDVILEETGREGRWCDLEGVHMYSYAIIMYLCACGSSLHVCSSLYAIYGLTNDTVLLFPSVWPYIKHA